THYRPSLASFQTSSANFNSESRGNNFSSGSNFSRRLNYPGGHHFNNSYNGSDCGSNARLQGDVVLVPILSANSVAAGETKL
ncbi:hypothetical protein TorRG33x02_010280, partial [Trema orientale]